MRQSGYVIQWYSLLNSAVHKALDGISDLEFQAYSTVLNFACDTLDNHGALNNWTYQSVTARVSRANGMQYLKDPLSLTNGYSQMLAGIVFSLDPTQEKRLQKVQQDSREQASALLTAYRSDIGPILPLGGMTELDYLLDIIIAGQWSGATPPLTFFQLLEAPDLARLLPYAPENSAAVIAALKPYLLSTAEVFGFMDLQSQASWRLQTALQNLSHPTAENGGVRTFNPLNGVITTEYHPRFTLSPASEVSRQLNDRTRKISFCLRIAQAALSSADEQVLAFRSAQGEFSLFANTDIELTVTYEGFALVSVAQMQFEADKGTGWFDVELLRQAYRNLRSSSESGFHFVNGVPVYAPDSFGFTSWLLIANAPQILVIYKKASDIAALHQNVNITSLALKPGAPTVEGGIWGELSIFSVIKPGVNRGYKVEMLPNGLQFLPEDIGTGGMMMLNSRSAFQQTADILAGVTHWFS